MNLITMLTNKQVILGCGLLSLGLHLCTWVTLNNNYQLWDHRSILQTSTIQVSLISTEIASGEKLQEKTQLTLTKEPPPVAAFPTTPPEIVSLPKTVKNVPRSIVKKTTSSPQQIISKKKSEQQLQKKTTKSVVVTAQAEELPNLFELHSVPGDNFEAQDSTVASHHGAKEVAIHTVEQTLPVKIANNQNQGKLVEESGREIKPAYLIHIQQMIEKHLDYPTRARRLHISGKVNLRFMITTNGDIDDTPILAESAYPILNKAAIHAVKQAAPFPQLQHKINVELPILFSLN